MPPRNFKGVIASFGRDQGQPIDHPFTFKILPQSFKRNPNPGIVFGDPNLGRPEYEFTFEVPEEHFDDHAETCQDNSSKESLVNPGAQSSEPASTADDPSEMNEPIRPPTPPPPRSTPANQASGAKDVSSQDAQPKSQASGRRRRSFTGTCSHSVMVRAYNTNLRCDICHKYGHFGWLYRCTHDREELIRQMIDVGSKQAVFDDVGKQLAKLVKPRPRGPEARIDHLSFFKEITPEQLRTYAPDQIATILRQRENVKMVIERDYAQKEDAAVATIAAVHRQAVTTKRQDYPLGHDSYRAASRGPVDTPEQWDELARERPWVPRLADECQYKVCPNCRPACADRVYISLDAVVNDDIPATAATGFGFHLFRRRPVCDVSVLSRSSQLAFHVEQPEVLAQTSSPTDQHPLPTSTGSREDSLARILAQNGLPGVHTAKATSGSKPRRESSAKQPPAAAEMPPSPSPAATSSSFFGRGQLTRSHQSPDLRHHLSRRCSSAPTTPMAARTGAAPSQDGSPDEAKMMPLLGAHADAERLIAERSTRMEEEESIEGEFGDSPLDVGNGVAVSEEGVELHVPDVIAQV